MSDDGSSDGDLFDELDHEWLSEVAMNGPAWSLQARTLAKRGVAAMCCETWVAVAASCMVLEGEQTDERETSQVASVCHVARRPLLDTEESKPIAHARCCSVPLPGVKSAVQLLRGAPVYITTPAVTLAYAEAAMIERLTRCEQGSAAGATEVEVMASPNHCGGHRWLELFHEIVAMREVAQPAKLVVTLPTEELGTLTAVRKAALVVMMGGASIVQVTQVKDEETRNCVGLGVMCGIKDFYERTGLRVGYGIPGAKSAATVLMWLSVLHERLGPEWAHPDYFRFSGDNAMIEIQSMWTQLELGKGTLPAEYRVHTST